MNVFQSKLHVLVAMWMVFSQSISLTAEQIPVRHTEGVALGFLALRNSEGEALAYGDWKQTVKPDGVVVDDLRFQFKDGSLYEEITKFTERGKFRLISAQVEQKGPSFKKGSKIWIDARNGTMTVQTTGLDAKAQFRASFLVGIRRNLLFRQPQLSCSECVDWFDGCQKQ